MTGDKAAAPRGRISYLTECVACVQLIFILCKLVGWRLAPWLDAPWWFVLAPAWGSAVILILCFAVFGAAFYFTAWRQ